MCTHACVHLCIKVHMRSHDNEEKDADTSYCRLVSVKGCFVFVCACAFACEYLEVQMAA